METIRGVEILAVGRWNNDEFTERELDDIVSASKQLDFDIALKAGHSRDEPGAPAYGWCKNIRRVGDKLLADFTDMHESVAKAIRSKAYTRVSAEVFYDLRRLGKTWRRALKAVALLGAEVPAVANLVPLHKINFALQGTAHAFEQRFETMRAGEEVDRLVCERMFQHPSRDYAQCLEDIMQHDRPLARAYAQENPVGGTARQADIAVHDAGERLHELALAHMKANGVENYADALNAVMCLEENRDLTKAYVAFSMSPRQARRYFQQ